MSSSYAAEDKPSVMSEIQILIDVSGSMKQNDPKNLRISALKLLVNLLPSDVKAGIWLFAENTKVLVKTGLANKAWKRNALKQIRKIHSRGLFTHIEDAIQNAAQPWFKSSGHHKRHLILLTDGMVDISKDIMQSAESRERVMMEQIPLLQQAGVTVQTIALSENADAELLDKLAFDTNGWSETAQTAEQLQKVFFKMFKKVVPQDTLPIKGNRFTVDAAVNEFSLLIFKKPNAPASQLIAPDNSKIISTNKKANVTWLNEKSYELVTINQPVAGDWRIVADMDPDNQVMIVTDLKFQLDGIPNHVAVKEPFDVMAFFTEEEQLVSREDFLSLINISVEQTGDKLSRKMQAVKDKAGLYSITLGTEWKAGTYTVKFIADGKTFQRESEKTIEVVDSAITIKTQVNKKERTVTIQLIADKNLLDTKMMTVQAIINQSGIDAKTLDMDKTVDNWQIVVAARKGEKKIINFSVLAKTIQGGSITPVTKPVIIDDHLFVVTEPEEEKVEEIVVETDVKEDVVEDEVPDEVVEEVKAPINWLKTSGIVVGINVVIVVAGFFGFKWLKKRSAEKQAQLLDRLA